MLVWSFKPTTSLQTENISAADRSKSVTQEISQCELCQLKSVKIILSSLPLPEKRPISQRMDLFPKAHISTEAGHQHCRQLKCWLQHSFISNTHLKDRSSSFFSYSPWISRHSNAVIFQSSLYKLAPNKYRHVCAKVHITNQPTNQLTSKLTLYIYT